jgi:hypothetical protein
VVSGLTPVAACELIAINVTAALRCCLPIALTLHPPTPRSGTPWNAPGPPSPAAAVDQRHHPILFDQDVVRPHVAVEQRQRDRPRFSEALEPVDDGPVELLVLCAVVEGRHLDPILRGRR